MDSAAEFPDAAEVVSALTGPGGEFEPAATEILGTRIAALPSRHRALHELLAEAAANGDRDYIVTETERIGFARFVDTVSAVAHALRDKYGVRPGDRVAIAAANIPAWITVFWASVSIGAVATACNAWWSRRELAWALDLTEPRVIFADERRAALLDDIPIPVVELPAGLDALTAEYDGAPLPSSTAGDDDPAAIIFTSGTSGRAKGAVHSHRNLLAVVEYHRLNDALAQAFGSPLAPEDRRYLLTSPLFHIASLHNLAVPRLATGSTVVMHTGAFDAGRVLRLIEREPAEVEGVIAEHPAVAECAVLGVPHEELGQEACAVVVTRDGTSVTVAELTEHARTSLAYFKVPAHWRITTEPLPRNATGKVVRKEVAVTGTTASPPASGGGTGR